MEDLKNATKETAWELGYAKGRQDAVQHGYWIDTGYANGTGKIFICSACKCNRNPNKKDVELGRVKETPDYCSSCGTKMDAVVVAVPADTCCAKNETCTKSIKGKVYFHLDKGQQIWTLEAMAEEAGYNSEKLRFLGSEVEMEIEVFKDGSHKVASIQGVDVSDKNISI